MDRIKILHHSVYKGKDTFKHHSSLMHRYVLIGGCVLLGSIVFGKEILPAALFFGVLGVLFLVILTWVLTPFNKGLVRGTAVISAAIFVILENYALEQYIKTKSLTDIVFFMQEMIALIFLGAVYFGVKAVFKVLSAEERREDPMKEEEEPDEEETGASF